MFLSMKREYTHLRRMVTGAIFASALLAPRLAMAAIPADKSAAVIFVYEHVGTDSAARGNISLDQFKEHINELEKGNYNVLPLAQIVTAVKNGTPLPPRTIGLTFDGAYPSLLANVVPLLEKDRMPFTIFFASDKIDDSTGNRMTWTQLRKLQNDGLASFGILPSSYVHMVNKTTSQNAALINQAVARYREMMGGTPDFFASPYGEFDTALKEQIAGYDFKAAFGEQSGVAYHGEDMMALPRFVMTQDYGDIDRFTLTANALPLPVSDIVPADPALKNNPPDIGFTVMPALHDLSKLACFASDTGKLPLTRLDQNRIEIRLKQPFTDRRTRINCTLPDETFTPGQDRNWRWFGMLLTVPDINDDASASANDDEAGQ